MVKKQQRVLIMGFMTTIAACDVLLLSDGCILHYNSGSLEKNVEDIYKFQTTRLKKQQCKITMGFMTTIS